MRAFTIVALLVFVVTTASAFTTSGLKLNKAKPALIGSKVRTSNRSSTLLAAAASGASKKKKATKKKKKATKKKKKAPVVEEEEEPEEVVTFRKPEFISRIAEKTGMSKADSEAALSAVLETITEVGRESQIFLNVRRCVRSNLFTEHYFQSAPFYTVTIDIKRR